jgi:hypothetical protein
MGTIGLPIVETTLNTRGISRLRQGRLSRTSEFVLKPHAGRMTTSMPNRGGTQSANKPALAAKDEVFASDGAVWFDVAVSRFLLLNDNSRLVAGAVTTGRPP